MMKNIIKFWAELMAVALAFAGTAAAMAETVTVTSQEELVAAVNAIPANGGGEIILNGDEFTLYKKGANTTGKSIAFIGQVDANGKPVTTWNYGGTAQAKGEGSSDYSFDGAGTISFKNVIFQDAIVDAGSLNYCRGFVRAANMAFENCKFGNMIGYWGTGNVSFKGCLFDVDSTYEYSLKLYSGDSFFFDGCTFMGNKKGYIQAYCEKKDAYNDVVVKDCVFIKKADGATKTAVYYYEYGASNAGSNWNMSFVGNNVSDVALWGDAKVATEHNSTITENGVKVWENGAKVASVELPESEKIVVADAVDAQVSVALVPEEGAAAVTPKQIESVKAVLENAAVVAAPAPIAEKTTTSEVVAALKSAASSTNKDKVTDSSEISTFVNVSLAAAETKTVAEQAVVKAMTFEVKPIAMTVVEGEVVSAVIPNAAITEAIVFRLPVDANATETKADVFHNGDKMGTYDVATVNDAKYIEVASATFSTFSYTLKEGGEDPTYAAYIGTQGYETIQAAVDAADVQAGPVTITVKAGTHDGEINLNKDNLKFEEDGKVWYGRINLVGEEGTIISGQITFGKGPVINVADLTFDGLTFDGTDNPIYIDNSKGNSKNITIKNNTFNYNGNGPYVVSAVVDGLTVTGNHFNCTAGNKATCGGGKCAINNVTISDNTFEDWFGIYGQVLEGGVVVSGNTFSNTHNGYCIWINAQEADNVGKITISDNVFCSTITYPVGFNNAHCRKSGITIGADNTYDGDSITGWAEVADHEVFVSSSADEALAQYYNHKLYLGDETAFATLEAAVAADTSGDPLTIVNYDSSMKAPEGWEFKSEGGVTKLVKKAIAVVEIVETGAKFGTFADAVQAVADGQTIKLLGDLTIAAAEVGSSSRIRAKVNYTLLGEGHKITLEPSEVDFYYLDRADAVIVFDNVRIVADKDHSYLALHSGKLTNHSLIDAAQLYTMTGIVSVDATSCMIDRTHEFQMNSTLIFEGDVEFDPAATTQAEKNGAAQTYTKTLDIRDGKTLALTNANITIEQRFQSNDVNTGAGLFASNSLIEIGRSVENVSEGFPIGTWCPNAIANDRGDLRFTAKQRAELTDCVLRGAKNFNNAGLFVAKNTRIEFGNDFTNTGDLTLDGCELAVGTDFTGPASSGYTGKFVNNGTIFLKNGSTIAFANQGASSGEMVVQGSTLEYADVNIATGEKIALDAASKITFTGTWSNAGDVSFDMTGATEDQYLLVENKGEAVVGDYGVTLTGEGYELQIIDGNLCAVKTVAAVAEIFVNGESKGTYETLDAAIKAAAAMDPDEQKDIELQSCEITESIKLPATLKNVTFYGHQTDSEYDGTSVLKNMTINSSDGNAYTYESVAFIGVVFDNSRIVVTGGRTGTEVNNDWYFARNTFRNLTQDGYSYLHFASLSADEPAVDFTFEYNTVDGSTFVNAAALNISSVSGEVLINCNEVSNLLYRPFNIQIANNDGIDDTVEFVNNTFTANGRDIQVLTKVANGQDNVCIGIVENIFKGGNAEAFAVSDSTGAAKIDLTHNYYAPTVTTVEYNGASIEIRNDAVAADLPHTGYDYLEYMGEPPECFSYYTGLTEDGEIDPDTLVEVKKAAAVCQIGEVTYPTLQEAIAAVPEGLDAPTTIKMIDDVVISEVLPEAPYNGIRTSVYIPANKSVILDLYGHKVEGRDDYVKSNFAFVMVMGKLVVDDTSEDGDGLISDTPSYYAEDYTFGGNTIQVIDGDFTLRNGTIENWGNDGVPSAILIGGMWKGGSCTIEGGTVYAYDYAIRLNPIFYVGELDKAKAHPLKLAIRDGYIYGYDGIFFHNDANSGNCDASIDITGGTIEYDDCGIYSLSRQGDFTMDIGGDVQFVPSEWAPYYIEKWDAEPVAVYSKSTVHEDFNPNRPKTIINIAGGYLGNVEGQAALWISNGGGSDAATITISGGVFDGTVKSYGQEVVVTDGAFSSAFDVCEGATGSTPLKCLRGGIYKSNLWTDNLADGYAFVENDDSETKDYYPWTIGVVATDVAAVISADGTTTNKFETLQAAIAAANDGDTVKLLANVTLPAGQAGWIGKHDVNITIDGAKEDGGRWSITAAEGGSSTSNLFTCGGDEDTIFKVVNCVINYQNTSDNLGVIVYHVGGQNIWIENCEINAPHPLYNIVQYGGALDGAKNANSKLTFKNNVVNCQASSHLAGANGGSVIVGNTFNDVGNARAASIVNRNGIASIRVEDNVFKNCTKSGLIAVESGTGVTLSLKGNTYTNCDAVFLVKSGTTVFTSDSEIVGVAKAIDVSSGATLKISGGMYAGSLTSSGAIALTGGIYSAEPDATYIAEGYEVVNNPDEETAATYPKKVQEKTVKTEDDKPIVVDISKAGGEPSAEAVKVPVTVTEELAKEILKVESSGELPTLRQDDIDKIVTQLETKGEDGMTGWQKYTAGFSQTDKHPLAPKGKGGENGQLVLVTSLVAPKRLSVDTGVKVKYILKKATKVNPTTGVPDDGDFEAVQELPTPEFPVDVAELPPETYWKIDVEYTATRVVETPVEPEVVK